MVCLHFEKDCENLLLLWMIKYSTGCAIFCLLLLLLSCSSRVRLCATPQVAAHQALPSLGFSRQEHWSGLPFPSPNAWKWKVKVKSLSRVWLCNPMDCSLPGSSVHGIFQARVLEWGAIAFSDLLARKTEIRNIFILTVLLSYSNFPSMKIVILVI